MVVSISHRGYIKRTPASVYRAQRRGGKGLKGATTEDEDPIEHLFVASTHAYLLFFTNKGKVYWQKVYELPELGRESRGRAIVNLLNLEEDEKITDCRAVRDFDLPGHFMMMATRKGLVKKTPLGGLQPAETRRDYRHQAARRRRTGRCRGDQAGRRSGVGHGQWHGDSVQRIGCSADGPQYVRREGDQLCSATTSWWGWWWPIPTPRC